MEHTLDYTRTQGHKLNHPSALGQPGIELDKGYMPVRHYLLNSLEMEELRFLSC